MKRGVRNLSALVSRVIATGVHEVVDLDSNPAKKAEEIAPEWVQAFGAKPMGADVQEARRCFNGAALVRVRLHGVELFR